VLFDTLLPLVELFVCEALFGVELFVCEALFGVELVKHY
jgi:hypothetical protein